MGTYLTDTGFKRRSYQEIVLALEQTFRDLYGPDIDLQPEGRTGHLIGLVAKALSDNWDGMQEVVSSLDPSQATGVWLDLLCALTGVFRIGQAKSRVWVACYVAAADDGTLIPAGRQVRRTRGALVFSLRTDVTVASTACRDLYLQLAGTPTPGDSVTLTTSFGTFTVTAPSVPNPAVGTYELLADAVNASGWTGTADAYFSGTGPLDAQFDGDCLRLLDRTTDFGLVSSAAWTPALIGSVGDFEATIYGTETVDPGEISEIVTPEPGWTLAYNLVQAIPGRLAETDSQLRIRREQLFGTGNATERALLNAIYNRVDGVLSASIRSNRTLATDSQGRPPKSFEMSVLGGTAEQIAAVIWDVQPAGIESFGNQSVDVLDSQGTTQTVKYTIPEDLWLWIDVRYERYDDESFPSNGETMLREYILEWATAEFTTGKDVFPRKVNSPIARVPGIGLVQIKAALTDIGVSPTFPTDFVDEAGSIVVGGRNVAVLTSGRLTITEGSFV